MRQNCAALNLVRTRDWLVVMSDWLRNEYGVFCAPMPLACCGRTGLLWLMHAARLLSVSLILPGSIREVCSRF